MGTSPEDRFIEFMASQRRTVTGPIARVAATALNFTRPFSAEEVVEALRGKISRATVYRTLTRMLEADVLRLIQFDVLRLIQLNGHENFEAVHADD